MSQNKHLTLWRLRFFYKLRRPPTLTRSSSTSSFRSTLSTTQTGTTIFRRASGSCPTIPLHISCGSCIDGACKNVFPFPFSVAGHLREGDGVNLTRLSCSGIFQDHGLFTSYRNSQRRSGKQLYSRDPNIGRVWYLDGLKLMTNIGKAGS